MRDGVLRFYVGAGCGTESCGFFLSWHICVVGLYHFRNSWLHFVIQCIHGGLQLPFVLILFMEAESTSVFEMGLKLHRAHALKHRESGGIMTIGEKIQVLRKQSGLSQEQLGALVGVSRQAISKWELGESIPDVDNVVQLSNTFGVTTDFLLKNDYGVVDESTAMAAIKRHTEVAEPGLKSVFEQVSKTKLAHVGIASSVIGGAGMIFSQMGLLWRTTASLLFIVSFGIILIGTVYWGFSSFGFKRVKEYARIGMIFQLVGVIIMCVAGIQGLMRVHNQRDLVIGFAFVLACAGNGLMVAGVLELFFYKKIKKAKHSITSDMPADTVDLREN